MSKTRRIAQSAGLAFVGHTVAAIGVLSLDRRPGGANVHGWDALRMLRAVDYPVLWAIDGILGRFLILPARWFAPNFELAHGTNVALTYVLVGGAFYAGLAALATVVLLRLRQRQTPP